MRISVAQAPAIVLAAMYENLYAFADHEECQADDVHRHVKDMLSLGYVRRILNRLKTDGFIATSQFDETSPIYYSVTDEGLVEADKLPPLKQLLDEQIFVEPLGSLGIPASDRIVSRSDNRVAIEDASRSIAFLQKEVRENNEVGAELGDERELVEFELKVAEEVLQQPRFRWRTLLGWLLPALKFLAEKFASGAIGEAAKRLVSLLSSLV